MKDVLPAPEKINDAIFYYARFGNYPNVLLRLDMTAHKLHIQLTDENMLTAIPLSAFCQAIGWR